MRSVPPSSGSQLAKALDRLQLPAIAAGASAASSFSPADERRSSTASQRWRAEGAGLVDEWSRLQGQAGQRGAWPAA